MHLEKRHRLAIFPMIDYDSLKRKGMDDILICMRAKARRWESSLKLRFKLFIGGSIEGIAFDMQGV